MSGRTSDFGLWNERFYVISAFVPTYKFLLGRNPSLSVAELSALLKIPAAPEEDAAFQHGYLKVHEPPAEFMKSPRHFLNRLGGTIKILEVLQEQVSKENLAINLQTILSEFFKNKSEKHVFGLTMAPENQNLLRRLLMLLKKGLRAQGGNARFVNKNFKNLSHVTVWNEKLATKGIELTIFEEKNYFSIAKTIAIQDFKSYGLRDYDKPFRDPKSGMLPPKLAQIMINLTVGQMFGQAAAGLTVIDPFCGTGTILMEALLMGYNAIGFDKSEKMTEGAKKNLEWLTKKIAAGETIMKTLRVVQKDAKELTKNDFPGKEPLAFVTESYLGPPMSAFPPQMKLESIIFELESLHLAFFKNLKKQISSGTCVVITFPFFRKATGAYHFLPLIEKITLLGYSKTDFSRVTSCVAPLKQGLLYDREDQIVGREIVKFIAR